MLDQAGDDLKRQLEEKNVNLLSLDVSTSGDQRDDQPGLQRSPTASASRPARRPRPAPPRVRTGDTGVVEAPAAAETTLVLPNGVLVDVLA